MLLAREQGRELSPLSSISFPVEGGGGGYETGECGVREEMERLREEERRKEGKNDEWRRSMKALIDGK